jgi:hypothetical protein
MDEGIEERIQEELYAYIIAAASTGVIPDHQGTELADNIFQTLSASIPELASGLASTANSNQAKDYLEDVLVEIAAQGASDASVDLDQNELDKFISDFSESISDMMEEEHLFAM